MSSRKHLSTLFEKGKEIFRGSSSECRKEICRILASKGIYWYNREFFTQEGEKVEVSLMHGEVEALDLKVIPDSKKKKQ